MCDLKTFPSASVPASRSAKDVNSFPRELRRHRGPERQRQEHLDEALATSLRTGPGPIPIDGYDIGKVELYSLRRQIGIVPQDPLLFTEP